MSEELTKGDSKKFSIGCLVLAIIIAFSIFNPIRLVSAGERAVLLNWGAFNGQILDPGFHLIIPIMQDTRTVNVQTQELKLEKSESYSKDLQMVDVTSQINYNILPDQVGEYYQQYNASLEGILIPRLEAAIKTVIAKYSAEELLHMRGQVQGEIFEEFKKTIPNVAVITNYSLVDEVFTAEYEAAIEKKQIAQQEAERAEYLRQQAEIEKETKILQAQGEAESIRIQSEAIQSQGGENFVQLQWVDAWKSGGAQVPQFITGENAGGFIYNMGQ